MMWRKKKHVSIDDLMDTDIFAEEENTEADEKSKFEGRIQHWLSTFKARDESIAELNQEELQEKTKLFKSTDISYLQIKADLADISERYNREHTRIMGVGRPLNFFGVELSGDSAYQAAIAIYEDRDDYFEDGAE